MLIEFRLKNFRSFKDEASLSMVASKDSTLENENTSLTGIQTPSRLVRTAVIYGGNASGKTNLIRGMQTMRGIVVASAGMQLGQQFPVQPFKLDRLSLNEPCLFEVTVQLGRRRFQYGFEVTAARVVGEWLHVYEKSKAQLWFERKAIDGQDDEYKFGSHLSGRKKVWQEATLPNALFLSRAVSLNSEALSPLYQWIAEAWNVFPEGGFIPFDFSTEMVGNPEGQSKITSMLAAADIAISSISAQPVKATRQNVTFDFASSKPTTYMEDIEIIIPHFQHQSGEIVMDLDYSDESSGTQKLFSLAGPIIDILSKGRLLVIDELERSLHPHLVRRIIQLFQDAELNCNGAQLIFSTHDATQLDATLLRRDQIWFADKLADQSSSLVSLDEFSARKGEAFERGYLSGRYGGIPILSDRLLAESDC